MHTRYASHINIEDIQDIAVVIGYNIKLVISAQQKKESMCSGVCFTVFLFCFVLFCVCFFLLFSLCFFF